MPEEIVPEEPDDIESQAQPLEGVEGANEPAELGEGPITRPRWDEDRPLGEQSILSEGPFPTTSTSGNVTPETTRPTTNPQETTTSSSPRLTTTIRPTTTTTTTTTRPPQSTLPTTSIPPQPKEDS